MQIFSVPVCLSSTWAACCDTAEKTWQPRPGRLTEAVVAFLFIHFLILSFRHQQLYSMAEEDFSILKKSVIPNLLQEGFQPTFLTEIEDTNDTNIEDNLQLLISKCQLSENENHLGGETIYEQGGRGSHESLSQDMSCDDVKEKRRSFISNIDYKKTLGNSLKFVVVVKLL